MDGRDGDGWGSAIGLFAAKIVPYRATVLVVLIRQPVWAPLRVGPRFVITQPPFYVLGAVGVPAYQDRIRRYVRPTKPVFVNLSCSSLAGIGIPFRWLCNV